MNMFAAMKRLLANAMSSGQLHEQTRNAMAILHDRIDNLAAQIKVSNQGLGALVEQSEFSRRKLDLIADRTARRGGVEAVLDGEPAPPAMKRPATAAPDPTGDGLTLLIPTRNRPALCLRGVAFLRAAGMTGRILIADSSDPAAIAPYASQFAPLDADLVYFDSNMRAPDKIAAALDLVDTAYVAQAADDDIALPDAIQQCHAFLKAHDDHSVAWGYALDFGIDGAKFDLHGVRWSAASVDDATPLERVYHGVRRYQPCFWSVARTTAMRRSLAAAQSQTRIVFQEMMCIVTLAMQGKIARLQIPHVLRGPEISQSARADTHPMFAILEGPGTVFREYAAYRDGLIAFADAHGIPFDVAPPGSTVDFLDMVHAIALARELDGGMLNYTVQRMLGAPLGDIPATPSWPGWREPEPGDLVHRSADPDRRYVWRAATMRARPGEEGYISEDMRADVERQLEHYSLRDPA